MKLWEGFCWVVWGAAAIGSGAVILAGYVPTAHDLGILGFLALMFGAYACATSVRRI